MIFFYNKIPERDAFIAVSEASEGSWIHIEEASLEDLQFISDLTGLDAPILDDSLDRYELPRLELIESNLILFTRHPVEQDRYLYTSTLTIILTPSYFITISPNKTFFIQHFLQKKIPISSHSLSDWMRQVLLRIAQEFNLFIRKTRHNILSQEKDMSAVTSEDIYALTKYEEVLNQYLSSLDALHLTLQKLFSLPSSNFYQQDKELIEDLINAVKQSENLSEIVIKNIRSLRDAYQIIFANSLTKTIKLLTALTIVFTIPNIVASIYGMNVRLPLSQDSQAFFILIGLMFILSSLCGYWFYRKNWM
jgi:magnesium transporter